jgi:hypothetical protein
MTTVGSLAIISAVCYPFAKRVGSAINKNKARKI